MLPLRHPQPLEPDRLFLVPSFSRMRIVNVEEPDAPTLGTPGVGAVPIGAAPSQVPAVDQDDMRMTFAADRETGGTHHASHP